MILDSIILENFGVYAGRQEACLTPEPGKPIILFGGMNGGGKTTLLDALQLAFYGSKAKLASRGKLAYKTYLRESIHRGTKLSEGASITVSFHRFMDGEKHQFELQRHWYVENKELVEKICVSCDGELNTLLSEHWSEFIESYLPSGIAHLFFFDGEQIKELAEGEHASKILGTAVYSLLGLDLVDRLEGDLISLERRKKTESLDPQILQELKQMQTELKHAEHEEEKLAVEEGRLVNEAGRLAKHLHTQEDHFRMEGGELYLRRHELGKEYSLIKQKKYEIESQLRDLAAGQLPLLLVQKILGEVEKIAQHENQIRHARILIESIEARDKRVLGILNKENISKTGIKSVKQYLKKDRQTHLKLARESLFVEASETLPLQIKHLSNEILPIKKKQVRELVAKSSELGEALIDIDNDLLRVPSDEHMKIVQTDLEISRESHQIKLVELNSLRIKRDVLQRNKVQLENKLDRVNEDYLKLGFAEDDRLRTLKHSRKVRNTLEKFRTNVVQRHVKSMEKLMLESFQSLLRKSELVNKLCIEPTNFKATLHDILGNALPFDRLSAGERQLLATSLLWGLARASGRPIPTIIDTPLGRLDSSHRKHLVERYFPKASHQVLLLSTDEEIIGSYYETLKPFVTRTFLMVHNEQTGQTHFENGYF
ncbi:MAG: DNA sulfur modification protein DndD [Nitrospinae bacterium]|uniref:DNA sulfur modification protein DndD n=1 Tax=Desulfobacula sp. TaxID=2593537 RepID=UPI0019A78788|nr:DNA sulfur modification protein DndD [Nitrospinota bacterium]MBL6995470.1 DNA sulfur modification protein DndD [Desulfobacula sp.]